MKKIILSITILALLASGISSSINTSAQQASTANETQGFKFVTLESSNNKPKIMRHPPAADYSKYFGVIKALPAYDPNSDSNSAGAVELRSSDLRKLDIKGDRLNDLLHSSFDTNTKWPKKLPSGFNPAKIMDLGKNPGLNVRKLHKEGITGKGIGIAIIDQTLLVDHVEYKDRLKMYEEIHNEGADAQMHGSAVSSIAVGKTVGVAPEANLYYIADIFGDIDKNNNFTYDFTWLAKAVDRILLINESLPKENKIRVISMSIGWSPDQKGYAEINAAVERAKAKGIFVVSSALSETYGYNFNGLGRDVLSDPDKTSSYLPGAWWVKQFKNGMVDTANSLMVPMDSRCIADPTGNSNYAFYRTGGWSWAIPYTAALYTLACQVKPDITPDIFWNEALKTGDTINVKLDGNQYKLGKIANPVKLIENIKKMK